jgi:hypothetical protein
VFDQDVGGQGFAGDAIPTHAGMAGLVNCSLSRLETLCTRTVLVEIMLRSEARRTVVVVADRGLADRPKGNFNGSRHGEGLMLSYSWQRW